MLSHSAVGISGLQAGEDVKVLDLSREHVDMVRDILSRHAGDRGVLVFGSGVKGCARRFSDIDIALEGSEPLSIMEMANLKEALSLSDLPFTVDVVDMCKADDTFRAVVASRHEGIYSPPGFGRRPSRRS